MFPLLKQRLMEEDEGKWKYSNNGRYISLSNMV
jgi:hypothetical protein